MASSKDPIAPRKPDPDNGSSFDPSKFSVAALSKGKLPVKSSNASTLIDSKTLASKPKAPLSIGTMLEEAGLISHDQLQDLLSAGNESAQSLKHALVGTGLVNYEDITSVMAESMGMESVDLREVDVTKDLLDQLNLKFVKKYHIFPVSYNEHEITIALCDPANVGPVDDLTALLNKRVVAVLAPDDQIDKFIRKWYEGDEIEEIYRDFTKDSDVAYIDKETKYGSVDLDEEDRNQHPAVRFVDLVFRHAVHDGASDIHIEPTRTGLRIRYRIDGVMQEIPQPPKRWQNMIISRLKVMSGMDLAIRRVPQDGRIKLILPDRSLDLRVSALPSIYGETIVMRILNAAEVQRGLDEVGFLPDTVTAFKKLIRSPNGVILMTGPTGSGKTTTLNAALSTLNNAETKIITVEDPVEYQIQGINQIQINAEVGMDFPIALRSMLRMSPDIIMVGEIRDLEVAEIAIRAALTGHLVFSTLHTNDAPSATIRLIDMGIKPYLVATSIQAVIAQRLIRRICSGCKEPVMVRPEALIEFGVDPNEYAGHTFQHGAGCERCNNTGYRGRVAIHEILEMDQDLRKMVVRSESTVRIKKTALAHGMRTLRMDGFQKALLGWTTLEEVMAATQMD